MFISARFPVVSPDGRINLRYDGPNAASPAHADGSQAVTLIDGGYADNTGTLAITRLLQTAPLAGNKRIYAISISNDPGRRGGTADELAEALACERTEPAASSGNFARLLGSPLATLDGIRAQASERRRAELSAAASGRFQLAPLLGCKDDVPIPLGWTLSAEARRQLDHRADQLLTPGSPLYAFLKKAYACAGTEASADGDNCL
jgi:hypothetical protein